MYKIDYLSNSIKKEQFLELVDKLHNITACIEKDYPNYKKWFYNTHIKGCILGSRNTIFINYKKYNQGNNWIQSICNGLNDKYDLSSVNDKNVLDAIYKIITREDLRRNIMRLEERLNENLRIGVERGIERGGYQSGYTLANMFISENPLTTFEDFKNKYTDMFSIPGFTDGSMQAFKDR